MSSLFAIGEASLSAMEGKSMERVKGIEPSYAAWEAAVLPLNYTRFGKTEEKFRRTILIWQYLFANFFSSESGKLF